MEVQDIKAIIFDTSVLLKLNKERMQKHVKDLFKFKKLFKEYQKGLIKNDTEFFNELGQSKKVMLESRKGNVKLKPSVKGILNFLLRNYDLAILSNMIKSWFLKDCEMLNFNHQKYFKNELFSQEIQTLKPSIKAFKTACKKIGRKTNECVYITDESLDIEGARNAGLITIFLGTNESNADLNIKDIKELIDLFAGYNAVRTAYEPGQVEYF